MVNPRNRDRNIGVFLVIDLAIARSAMQFALDRAGALTVVGSAPTSSAVARARAVRPDITAIFDHRGQVSFDVCRELSRDPATGTCMFVLTNPNRATVHAALNAGADGLLSSESTFDDFIAALTWLHHHGSFIDPRLSAFMVLPPEPALDERQLLERLSDGERAVLDLLARGYTNREIGDRLHLSDLTIRNKVSSILRKLEVASRVEAAVFAVEMKYHATTT